VTSVTIEPAHPGRWLALMGVGLGVLMATLDVSIVNLALPTLVEIFRTNFATIQWIALGYALVLTTLLLSAARLGDMISKKKVYLAGLALFTLASLLCGLSPGVGWLIGFRALQGLGAVMAQALGVAIVTEVFPVRERGRALGAIGGIVSVGLALGPPLGGLLIGYLGWRSIFLVNVPLGLVALTVISRKVPSLPPGESGQRFDLIGTLIVFLTLGCYTTAMTWGQERGFGDPIILALLAGAGLGFLVLLKVEARLSQPMIDRSIFDDTLFSLNLIMGFLCFVTLGGFFIIPFILQLGMGYPTEQVGLLMMTVPILMGLIAPWAGGLSDRWGPRWISLAGLVWLALGCLTISTLTVGTPWWGYVLRVAPLGIGMGMFQSPNNSAIMGAVPRHRLGLASGFLSLSRTLGQTTGLPLIGALFTLQMMSAWAPGTGAGGINQAPPEALLYGVQQTYRLVSLIILAAIVLAVFSIRIDRRRKALKTGSKPSE